MAHPAGKPSHAAQVTGTALRVLVRVVMVVLGSLAAIGGGAKPALPPEVTLPRKQYRP